MQSLDNFRVTTKKMMEFYFHFLLIIHSSLKNCIAIKVDDDSPLRKVQKSLSRISLVQHGWIEEKHYPRLVQVSQSISINSWILQKAA